MDEFLFRKLKPGNQFDSLFPNSTCERVELGQGDTDYSIEKMVEWIHLNQDQTTKVAQLLAKSSLQSTCNSFHDFLYWYFQYKADADDQLLRSPACAWKQRYDGIDCKSYSIIASCLLLNEGINHYIRKVGYTVPGEYTHVYVIVPINQQTNDLNEGYYMIDGTINTMQEPFYVDEKDELIMSLQHFGLKRPYRLGDPIPFDSSLPGVSTTTTTTPTPATTTPTTTTAAGQFNWSKITDLFKINFKTLLSSLSCLGGSGLGDAEMNQALDKMNTSAGNLVNAINAAVSANDNVALSKAVLDFRTLTLHMNNAYLAKNNSNHWNSCTTHNLDVLQHAGDVYAFIINPALDAWLAKYFTATETTKGYVNMPDFEASGVLNWVWLNGARLEYDIPNFNYEFTGVAIPQFELNQYLINVSGGGFNADTYLATLQTVINTVHTPATSATGTAATGTGTIVHNSDGTYTQNGIKYDANGKVIPTTPQTAGFGWVAGIAIGLIGLSLATGGFKNLKPTGKKDVSSNNEKK